MTNKLITGLAWLMTIILIFYSGVIIVDAINLLTKGYLQFPLVFILESTYISVLLLNILNLMTFFSFKIAYREIGIIVNVLAITLWGLSIIIDLIRLLNTT